MKFWPRLLRAAMPWRAMTSRSGGSVRERLGTQRRAAPRRHLGSQPQRRDQAVGPRDPLSGDIERGAVVGRSADKRQPQRHVYRAVEIERLDRDQRLIVVHAQRRVVSAARGGVKHRVGGERPSGIDACRAQFGYRRRDDLDVLASEPAGLPGMRIEPGDRDNRRSNRKITPQRRVDDASGMDDRRTRQAFDRLTQRQVDRHGNDTQFAACQHHHRRFRRARELGEILGVAGVMETGAVERVLVDRVGDKRGGATGADIGDGGFNGVQYQRLVSRIGVTRPCDRGAPERRHGHGVGEYPRRLIHPLDRPHRDAPTKLLG